MLATTTTADTGSEGGFWGGLSDLAYKWIDLSIDDSFGLLTPPQNTNSDDIWGNWAPEQTAPTNDSPTEPGFVIGNNPKTWGAGLLVLGIGFLLFKAVK